MQGRVSVVNSIVKGEDIPEPGIPESFRVLMYEMRSLCLNVEALDVEGNAIDLSTQNDSGRSASEELGISMESRPSSGALIDDI
jgi:DNA-directed RNA polymerase subunit beta